jgi:hypothetical protein
MKYDAGVFIKLIIHQFKHISGAVEANSDVFVFISFHWAVILVVLKSMAYVLSADTMPKRRVIELNNDFHIPILVQIAGRGKCETGARRVHNSSSASASSSRKG